MTTEHTHLQKTETLAKRLLANPELIEPLEAILALLDAETALGRKADDVEQIIVEQMRLFGRTSLQGWAQRASHAASSTAKGHVHKKKASGG